MIDKTQLAENSIKGAALIGSLSIFNPYAVAGAAVGALLFVRSRAKINTIDKIILFLSSFLMGILCARTFAAVVAYLLPFESEIDLGLGGALAAAITVLLIQRLIWGVEHPSEAADQVSSIWDKVKNIVFRSKTR